MYQGCILILSCGKEKYTKERIKQWNSISKIADKIPIFYLFGKTNDPIVIPKHKNVTAIVSDCNDNYEDIPLKMYYGIQYLRSFNFSYIIKLDETLTINEPNILLETIDKEIKEHDYIAIKGSAPGGDTSLSSWHQKRTTDKRFRFLFGIIYGIKYAGGPAYAISKKAIQEVKKEYYIASLYEDYALGYNLYNKGIKVSQSSLINSGVISDDSEYNEPLFPNITIPVDTKTDMDKNINDIASPMHNCHVYMFGGLGNQLFQLATALNLCITNNMNLKLCIPNHDNIRPYYFDNLLCKCKDYLVDYRPQVTHGENGFSYKPIEYKDQDMVLQGYFQSLKYFSNIVDSIRHLLTFDNNVDSNIKNKYGDIFSKNCVIVHARRGDYLNAIDFHGVMDDEYYKKSISIMKTRVENPIFILLSDDIDYWKKSTIFGDEKFVIFNENEIHTLYLMINSHNFIIPNSTFSWWGATISRSENVIAPSRWFGPRGPQDWQDIYNPGWTIV